MQKIEKKKNNIKIIAVFGFAILLLLTGYIIFNTAITKTTTAQLLKAVTETAMNRVGSEGDLYITEIDITAYSGEQIGDFEEWVVENYTRDDRIIIVMTDESQEIKDDWELRQKIEDMGYDVDYNMTIDWTTIDIAPAGGIYGIPLKKDVDIGFHYHRLGSEGYRLTMRYNGTNWEYVDAEERFRS